MRAPAVVSLRLVARLASLVSVACGTVLAFAATPKDAPEPIRLELVAHAGCPDANTFFAEMRNRTPRIRRADSGEKARVFRLEIVQVSGKSVGKLVIAGDETRTMTGGTCAEVISAMAFVAAVAVDPAVALGPPASTTATASLSASASEASSEAFNMTSATATASSVMSPILAAPAVSGSAVPASTTPRRSSTVFPPNTEGPRLAGGVGIAAFGAGAVGLVLSPSLHLELRDRRGGSFSPAGRLSIARGTGDVDGTVGSGHFRWTVAQLDVCPIRFALWATLDLRACAGFEGGALRGEGQTGAPRSENRLWLAPRLLGRLEWTLFDTLVLDAHAGIAAPLLRDRFVFDPEIPLYRAPAIYPFFGISVGVFFW